MPVPLANRFSLISLLPLSFACELFLPVFCASQRVVRNLTLLETPWFRFVLLKPCSLFPRSLREFFVLEYPIVSMGRDWSYQYLESVVPSTVVRLQIQQYRNRNVKQWDKCMYHVVTVPSPTRVLQIWGHQKGPQSYSLLECCAIFCCPAKDGSSEAVCKELAKRGESECCLFSSRQRWLILYSIAIYNTRAKLTMSYIVLHLNHVLLVRFDSLCLIIWFASLLVLIVCLAPLGLPVASLGRSQPRESATGVEEKRWGPMQRTGHLQYRVIWKDTDRPNQIPGIESQKADAAFIQFCWFNYM